MKGMSVTEGQLLISGVEDTGTFGTRFTAGLGSGRRRTWYTLTGSVPAHRGAEKRYTGREKRLRSVIFGSRRIKFFANSSIDSGQCDKITERTPVRVCGIPLPIIWETETLRFYETEPVTVTQARRQKETGAALEASISTALWTPTAR
ncbi:MAG: sporulation protein YqfD [Dysosmobacter sp.]